MMFTFLLYTPVHEPQASLVTQWSRIYLPMQEMQVQSPGSGRPPGKEMATHSSIPAWEISWTEEPGELWSMVSLRLGHN